MKYQLEISDRTFSTPTKAKFCPQDTNLKNNSDPGMIFETLKMF